MENWQKASFNPLHLTEELTGILISAYGTENYSPSSTQEPTNQWVMFLKLADDKSIMVYMNSATVPALLNVSSKSYTGTYNTVKDVDFKTHGEPTVQQIFDIISSKRRDKFEFTEDLEGCRHWILTVITDFEEANILSAGAKITARDALTKYWHTPMGSGFNDRELKHGTFL